MNCKAGRLDGRKQLILTSAPAAALFGASKSVTLHSGRWRFTATRDVYVWDQNASTEPGTLIPAGSSVTLAVGDPGGRRATQVAAACATSNGSAVLTMVPMEV